MKKIGVLFGTENSFPSALVEQINARNLKGITAEFVQVGAVELANVPHYAVIVDRISHLIPFYRTFLKHASLQGTAVLNDPFRCSADDKFVNCALAARLGVAVPPTVILPHKQLPGETTEQSVRNLEYPLDWESVFATIGDHSYLKPVNGGRDLFEVYSREEFFNAYDASHDQCMMVQKAVDYTAYYRCYVVGQKQVRVMGWDPRRPHGERCLADAPVADKKLIKRMEQDAVRLCQALGYDLNTVEFALADGVPYAIDFMNPVPDADVTLVGQDNFDWLVKAVADLAISRAGDAPETLATQGIALPEPVPAVSAKAAKPAKVAKPAADNPAAKKKAGAKKPAVKK
jgi:glutathione synthase/RimK-type ligase-like ATP-grasp enzyme